MYFIFVDMLWNVFQIFCHLTWIFQFLNLVILLFLDLWNVQYVVFIFILLSKPIKKSFILVSHFDFHFTLFSPLLFNLFTFYSFKASFYSFSPIEARNIWFPILIFILLFLAPWFYSFSHFPLFRLHFTLFRPIEARNILFPILILSARSIRALIGLAFFSSKK